MSRIPQSTIDELRRLESEATPGGWEEGRAGNADVVHFDGDDIRPVAGVSGAANKRLIVAMRNSIVTLLDERDELTRLVHAARAALNDCADEIGGYDLNGRRETGHGQDTTRRILAALRAVDDYFAPAKEPGK